MHCFLVSDNDVLALCAQPTVLPELEHPRVLDLAFPLWSLPLQEQRFHKEIEDDGKSGPIECLQFLSLLLLG